MERVTESFQWSLSDQGDLLEHAAAEFVRNHISAYERTWASYIGHDGFGRPADLLFNDKPLPLDAPLVVQRQLFAQNHYTALEALYSLFSLELNPENKEYMQYHGSFLRVTEQLILFHAQIGRLSECLERAADAIKFHLSDEKLEDLKLLYKLRCNVIHGARIPQMYGPYIHLAGTTWEREHFILEPLSWDSHEDLWTMPRKESEYKNILLYILEKKALAVKKTASILEAIHSGVLSLMKREGIALSPPLTNKYHRYGGSGLRYSSWEESSVFELPASGTTTSVVNIVQSSKE